MVNCVVVDTCVTVAAPVVTCLAAEVVDFVVLDDVVVLDIPADVVDPAMLVCPVAFIEPTVVVAGIDIVEVFADPIVFVCVTSVDDPVALVTCVELVDCPDDDVFPGLFVGDVMGDELDVALMLEPVLSELELEDDEVEEIGAADELEVGDAEESEVELETIVEADVTFVAALVEVEFVVMVGEMVDDEL